MSVDWTQWPLGYKRHIFETIDSTNAEAKRVISAYENSANNPIQAQWIFAHEQLSGKGRRGRAWSSVFGSFAATVILPLCNEGPTTAMLRSFSMAVSVLATVKNFLDEDAGYGLYCKWPNDIMWQNHKLSGILLESIAHKKQHIVLIGVGINLVPFKRSSDWEKHALEPISLHEITKGKAICGLDILTQLARKFDVWEKIYKKNGFDPVRKAWLEYAQGVGKNITVRLGNGQSLHGIFEGIDNAGLLKLRDESDVRLISAADIFLC